MCSIFIRDEVDVFAPTAALATVVSAPSVASRAGMTVATSLVVMSINSRQVTYHVKYGSFSTEALKRKLKVVEREALLNPTRQVLKLEARNLRAAIKERESGMNKTKSKAKR